MFSCFKGNATQSSHKAKYGYKYTEWGKGEGLDESSMPVKTVYCIVGRKS